MLHPSGSVQYSSLRISYRSSESSKWKMTIERQQLEQTQRVSNHCYLPFYKKKKEETKEVHMYHGMQLLYIKCSISLLLLPTVSIKDVFILRNKALESTIQRHWISKISVIGAARTFRRFRGGREAFPFRRLVV